MAFAGSKFVVWEFAQVHTVVDAYGLFRIFAVLLLQIGEVVVGYRYRGKGIAHFHIQTGRFCVSEVNILGMGGKGVSDAGKIGRQTRHGRRLRAEMGVQVLNTAVLYFQRH